jgi:hypothetical protein
MEIGNRNFEKQSRKVTTQPLFCKTVGKDSAITYYDKMY